MTSSPFDGLVGKKFGNSNKLGNTDKDDNIIIGNKKNSSNKGKTKMDINDILEKKSKKEVTTYKYSNNGRDSLHEAIILNGKPRFITYDKQNDMIQIKDLIEESTRIINPPSQEGYPYTPYEFESERELHEFFNRAKKIDSLDPLYQTAKSIFQKYVDQDVHIITILSVDCILTHFQDLFPTIHYSEGIGDNDVGKSSIGYTFEYTAYRVVKGTSISGANYYRLLGTIEPGQCTIIEDEGDNISDDPDKIRLLKAGYEYSGKIPKINMNSKNQEQKWYYGYCYKMILAERSLSHLKAKGLIDRTFTLYCRPGKVKYSIKEVVSDNINKAPKLQDLHKELIDFRKLMICYRLVHYRDESPQITTNLKNRDNELCKPLLQLFYGTKALNEIKEALGVFVKQRRERKSNSIEAALYPILNKFIYPNNNYTFTNAPMDTDSITTIKFIQIPFSEIWNYIRYDGGIAGKYDEKRPNQYETFDYGILYQNTLSKLIADKFGAKLDRKSYGSFLTFERHKFDYFKEVYDENNGDDGKAKVDENSFKIEVRLEASDEYDDEDVGSVGNEGSRRCVDLKSDSNYNDKKDNQKESSKISENFTNRQIKNLESNNKEGMHILEPTQPAPPTSNLDKETSQQFSETVTNTGLTLYHCPHCKFENKYPKTIAHHIKYKHLIGDNTSISEPRQNRIMPTSEMNTYDSSSSQNE